MEVFDVITSRVVPAAADVAFSSRSVWVAIILGVVGAAWRPAWQVLKLLTTLVHELGHAFVAMLCGRQFTALVVRSDMSGHAVTVGKPTGVGRVATTWAGYPAPAVVAAAAALTAATGYAAAMITVLLVLCVVAVTRARSLLTVGFLLLVVAGLAATWWWRDDMFQAQLLICLSVLLVFGAWRHLSAVAGSRSSSSDAAALRDLTGVPSSVWVVTFFVAICCGTVATVWSLATHGGLS